MISGRAPPGHGLWAECGQHRGERRAHRRGGRRDRQGRRRSNRLHPGQLLVIGDPSGLLNIYENI